MTGQMCICAATRRPGREDLSVLSKILGPGWIELGWHAAAWKALQARTGGTLARLTLKK